MIDEAQVEEAVQFLIDSAPLAAKARGERVYESEMRKHVRAVIASQQEGPESAKLRLAEAHPKYLEQLQKERDAVVRDEEFRARREGASAKIACWQTESANYRGTKI